jgi:hypothetical protein
LILSELIAAAYLKATGEISVLTSSDDDWKKLVALANFYIDNWQNEPGVDWASLYDPAVNIGTVTATDTFDLDDSIRSISNQVGDYVRINHLNSTTYTNYQTVEPKRLKYYAYGAYCARVGKTLKFNRAFTSTDPQFGGTINVPSNLFADHLSKANDVVPVDDPNWLVLMCAAEYVRNDITRAQNYPDIVAEAVDVMKYMKKANNSQVEEVPRSPVARGMEW